MGEKIVVGPINKGLKTDREPFVIDNDSFPVLLNAYQWRGRVKRKRGTSLLNRLQRYFNSSLSSYSSTATITLDAGGNGNLLTGFGLQSNGAIIPGSVTITDTSSMISYTDPSKDGTLSPSGSIDYATGEITILAAANDPVNVIMQYYPCLPVMGLEDLNLTALQFPNNIAFDTTYAYNILTSSPYSIYNVSFYKNPASNGTTLPGYVPKTHPTPVNWNGQNYQQFWTTNYENALWATNGITVPFTTANIGMQFKPIVTATVLTEGPPATVSLNIVAHGLVVGDFVFINEVLNITGINFQTGYVITVSDANHVIVEFPNATMSSSTQSIITAITQANPAVITTMNTFTVGQSVTITDVVGMTQLNGHTYVITHASSTSITINVDSTGFTAYSSGGIASLATGTGGIAQYLTNSANTTLDCLRWYDGDPTNGVVNNPSLNQPTGWVNFMPPISNGTYSIGDLPPVQYYLVGARVVLPFKDRILFFGPVIQSSSTGPFYLQDTIIYSQNGTPYYTASFTGSLTSAATTFYPILTPFMQSAAPNAYFSDVEGYGGFITAGYAQPIISVMPNQDVLMVAFTSRQTKIVYSGNDLVPFNFFIVNSELGTGSTFSGIVLDRGNYSIGDHGIIIANQVQAERIDLEIPDQVFEFNLSDNGPERVAAQRDYIDEWVYFSYPSNTITSLNPNQTSPFPSQTLLYNYRDNSWAIFTESYTTYGQIRRVTGDTWGNIGQKYPTWGGWTVPWNYGETTLLQPQVMAGNAQGFVMLREQSVTEGTSLYISGLDFDAIATITGATKANPCVLTAMNSFMVGQDITISGVVGMVQLNGNTYTITAVSSTTITINVDSTSFTAYGSGGTASANPIISPNHGLNNGDYIIISGCIGTISTQLNGNIFSVFNVTQNTFNINPNITSGTYYGGGLITRMYVPFIQTKQFPPSWGMSRKTRIGPQQYLFTTTSAGQIELQIYLSQDGSNPYNYGPVVPSANSQNNALVYTDTLFTSPIYEIVNCFRSSLGSIGNGSSTSYTLSYQMIYGFQGPIIQGSVSITVGTVATFTDNGLGGFTATGTGTSAGSSINYLTGVIVIAFTSAPTSQASFTTFQYGTPNIQNPTGPQQQQLWQRMNTSLIGDSVQLGFTMNDAQMRDPFMRNQFAEIELQAIVIDVSPSQLLA